MENRNLVKIDFADFKINPKIKLSALWTSLMFCYIYGDYFLLYVPGKVEGLISGENNLNTPLKLYLASLLLVIPALMICLSILLKPRLNRWINIIFGIIYTFIMLLLTVTSISEWLSFYIFLGIVESIITILIVWNAIKWPKIRNSIYAKPKQAYSKQFISKVKEENTTSEHIERGLLGKIDSFDTFSTTNQENNLKEITHLIFNNTPKWIKWLFNLRNRIAKSTGLNTEVPADCNERFSVGGYIGFFKIFSINEQEIVLGANDSHLNFRVIVANSNEALYNIKVITLVQYNNSTGKIYMSLIKPFHRVVVKRMIRNAYKQKRLKAC